MHLLFGEEGASSFLCLNGSRRLSHFYHKTGHLSHKPISDARVSRGGTYYTIITIFNLSRTWFDDGNASNYSEGEQTRVREHITLKGLSWE
jgi:hypothetical protein